MYNENKGMCAYSNKYGMLDHVSPWDVNGRVVYHFYP